MQNTCTENTEEKTNLEKLVQAFTEFFVALNVEKQLVEGILSWNFSTAAAATAKNTK